MKYFPTFLRFLLPAWLFTGLAFGGDSESSSETNTTSNQYDQRVTSGQDGVAISNGSNNVITRTTTDLGAVKAGTELSRQALLIGAASADAFASNTKAVFDTAIDTIGTAYETAKAGDQRVFKMTALGVIGLAAVVMFPAIFKKG